MKDKERVAGAGADGKRMADFFSREKKREVIEEVYGKVLGEGVMECSEGVAFANGVVD